MKMRRMGSPFAAMFFFASAKRAMSSVAKIAPANVRLRDGGNSASPVLTS